MKVGDLIIEINKESMKFLHMSIVLEIRRCSQGAPLYHGWDFIRDIEVNYNKSTVEYYSKSKDYNFYIEVVEL